MNKRFYIRIVIMFAALYGVVSVIKSLNSGVIEKKAQDPSSALSVLIGSELRPLNWCPLETMAIQAVESKVIANTPDEISRICELMVSPATKEDSKVKSLHVLTAIGRTKTVKLYLSPADNFSVDGLPFQSKVLLQILKEKGLRPE